MAAKSAEAAQAPYGFAPEGEPALAERYRIVPESPLKEFDLDGAPAFVARDKKATDRLVMARICDPGILPRTRLMEHMRSWREQRVVHPLEWGPVFWPPAGEMRMAVILDQPHAKRVMPSLEARIRPISGEVLTQEFLAPIAYTLQRFGQRNLCHGSIRPDLLYRAESGAGALIMNDCVATPPGWTQHPAFQTIQSSMTPRRGIGDGSIDDDLYALGATILSLALGHCPFIGLDRRRLIERKVERGSLMTLLNGESPPLNLREPLRGLLSDDPENRWRLEDLLFWITGALRRTVRPSRHAKSDRPFEFDGHQYGHVRLLAEAFGQNWETAATVVRSQPFINWLRRGVSDQQIGDAVEEVLASPASDGDGATATARLVARVCVRLDPPGPIRFKGMALMPTGLGALMYDAVRKGDRAGIQNVVDLLSSGLVFDWYEGHAPGQIDLEPFVKQVRKLQQFLRHSGPGYGVERCLYELCPDAPCQSAMLRGFYVSGLETLLPALDHIVARDGALPVLVDRHVVAFIAYHYRKPIGTQLQALEDAGGTGPNAKLAMLSLLAKIQHDYGPASLPHLVPWIARELEPLLGRFKSRTTREQLEKRLGAAAESGSATLTELHALLSNDRALKRDAQECNQAMREHAKLLRDIQKLDSQSFQEEAQRTGWRIAAGLSMAIACATVATLVFW